MKDGAMTCLECAYFSMWDGVCMCPVSPNLWHECWDAKMSEYKEACKDFEEENDEYRCDEKHNTDGEGCMRGNRVM